MLAVGEYLYVASTWGCVIVLDNVTMTSCVTFRPHSDVAPYIRFLLPLRHETPHNVIVSPGEEHSSDTCNGLLSVGMGYRHLLAKHVKSGPPEPVNPTDVCLLSWLAEHWKYMCSTVQESVSQT